MLRDIKKTGSAAIRLMEYSVPGFAITDARTYSTDLADANARGRVNWTLEYSTLEAFGRAHFFNLSEHADGDRRGPVSI